MSFGRFQLRRDTSTNWTTANPVLASGEIGYDLTVKQFKIGDGSTAWSSLQFLGAGSVTSINASGGTTGLSFTGGPVTTSGTLTLTGTLAIANGGTGATTATGGLDALSGVTTTSFGRARLADANAAAAVTALGGTTVGSNLFTLTNPAAISFLRVNADNTVSALDAATFRSAIGAGVGTVTSVGGTGTVAGISLSGTVTGSGNLTLSGTLSTPVSTINDSTTVGRNLVTLTNPTAVTFLRVNADNSVSALDAATFRSAIGAGVGSVTSVSGTGTVSGLTLSGTVTGSGNITLGGTLSVAASNFASQTANTFLAAPNGSAGTPTFRAIVAADIPTLNQNTTGTASNVTGTVAIANGGTGATTAPNARTNLGATTVGSNIFTLANPSAIRFVRINADNTVTALSDTDFRTAIGAGTGNGSVTSVSGTGTVAGLTLSGTVTGSGNLTLGGTLSTPASTISDSTTVGRAFLTLANPSAIAFPRINADNTVTAQTAANFRTDLSAAASGDVTASGLTMATARILGRTSASTGAIEEITIGSGLSLSAGTLTATGGGTGTVTSVDVSGGTTGLTTSGGPVTASGTITLAGTLAVANGGTGATDAGTARTNLGATTVGGSFFTLANPSAITFPRINANNTVTAQTAANYRTDLGATTVGSSLFTLTNPSAITFLRINADNTVTAQTAANFRTDISAAASGAVTASGLTMATARLLGRTTASTGAIEEISIGSNLTLSAGVLSATSGGASTDFQEFAASGTWTKPAGAKAVLVEVWGAGGGGGSGRRGTAGSSTGGAGGGGGAYNWRMFDAADLPSSVAVTIGAGGNGGAAQTVNSTNGNAGSAGGNTMFGPSASVTPYVMAYGGGGGPAGSNASIAGGGGGGISGAGSTSTGGTGPTASVFGGASGSSAANGSEAAFGGAAGGGASTTSTFAGGRGIFSGAGGGAGGPSASAAGLASSAGAGGIGYVGYGGLGGAEINFTNSSFAVVKIEFANNTFVAMRNDAGNIGTSANGTSWTQAAGIPGHTIESIIHDGSRWVALAAQNTTNRVFTSSDLITWSCLYDFGFGAGLRHIAFGSGIYVIVGTSSQLFTSTNLYNWQARSVPSATYNWVTWDGSRFLACGSSSTVLRSTDGVTWTAATTAPGSGLTLRVIASSGSVQVTRADGTDVYRSTDGGNNWSLAATTLASTDARGVLFAGGQWVLAGASNVYTSSDGNTWTLQTDGTTDTYQGIAYGAGVYVVGSVSSNSNVGISSPDGVTWTTRTVSATQTASTAGSPGGIACGGGGGGGSANGFNSGAGGRGGDGFCRVTTW